MNTKTLAVGTGIDMSFTAIGGGRQPGKPFIGGQVFRCRGRLYMALSTNHTCWNAVNLETGDLATIDGEESVAELGM